MEGWKSDEVFWGASQYSLAGAIQGRGCCLILKFYNDILNKDEPTKILQVSNLYKIHQKCTRIFFKVTKWRQPDSDRLTSLHHGKSMILKYIKQNNTKAITFIDDGLNLRTDRLKRSHYQFPDQCLLWWNSRLRLECLGELGMDCIFVC